MPCTAERFSSSQHLPERREPRLSTRPILQMARSRQEDKAAQQMVAKLGGESSNLCFKTPAVTILTKKSPPLTTPPSPPPSLCPPSATEPRCREGNGERWVKDGERAQPGSTHQYVNVLLLIQQQPHLLYIAVEDGLDQRRLQRKREARREGGTTWGRREGEPAALPHQRLYARGRTLLHEQAEPTAPAAARARPPAASSCLSQHQGPIFKAVKALCLALRW